MVDPFVESLGPLAGLAAAVGALLLFALWLSMRRDLRRIRESLAHRDRDLEKTLLVRPTGRMKRGEHDKPLR